LYQSPLSEHARERLRIIRETNDGFELAEQDLKMRGAGELLGTRQTGSLSFKVADLLRDQALLPQVSASARIVLEDFPDRIEPLINRWVGSREGYVNA
jgi:ATP-dependent DNA helicase RecG